MQNIKEVLNMGQSLSKMLVHLIFSTQDRIPHVTQEIKPELESYMASVLKAFDSPALHITAVSDHVHILFLLSRKYALSPIVQSVKGKTSKWIKSKEKRFQTFMWQNGFGAFSVSESNKGAVLKYLSNQEQHHKKTTFKEEFLLFLAKHKISFDEKYIWD
jgi:REP element-mobilizing transposase RayT